MKTALAILILSCLSAREINVGDSVEWMTVDCDLIVTGRKIRVEKDGIVLRVAETLKGAAEPELRVPLRGEWLHQDRLVLLFLRKEEGGWTLRSRNEYGLIDLEAAAKTALTVEMKVLRKSEEILDRVKARIKLQKEQPERYQARAPKPEAANVFTTERGFLRIEVEFNTEAHALLYAGSSCYLVVPPDPVFQDQALALARSESARLRERGARWLANFPGKEVAEALKPLLKDAHREKDLDGRARYPVRRAAYESLRALGVDVEKPVLED